MIEELVHFYADRLKLEGVRTYNEDTPPSPAILLCALHPNLGGDMDNNVITSLAHVFQPTWGLHLFGLIIEALGIAKATKKILPKYFSIGKNL